MISIWLSRIEPISRISRIQRISRKRRIRRIRRIRHKTNICDMIVTIQRSRTGCGRHRCQSGCLLDGFWHV